MASPNQMADWLASIAGQTGVNSVWLKRAADAGAIVPGMSADEVYRAVASMASPPPPRQLQLPMGSSEDNIRALIPYGSRGPGMPTDLAAPGVAMPTEGGALIPAPLRGLPAPQQARIGTTASVPTGASMGVPGLPAPAQRRLTYNPVETAARSMDSGVPAEPDFGLGSPLWHQMDKGARAFDNLRKGRTANLRNQNPDLVRIAQDNIREAGEAARPKPSSINGEVLTDAALMAGGVGAAGALGAAAYSLLPDTTPVATGAAAPAPKPAPQPAAPKPSTTADLAAESRPVPKVAATDKDGVPTDEGKFTEMFKRQYQAREDKRQAQGKGGYASPSDKAKAILDDLNARRRKAGGEVPEAPQMIAEANRLLAEGNEQRNAPGYKPAPMSNPREQAQALLQKLNADRMAAGGEVPHSQKVLAEVRRLQALADSQRWGG